MSDQMTGRWYPVAISGQRFTPVGQNNLSGYATYNEAHIALEEYDGDLDEPYAIIFVQETFRLMPLDPQYKLVPKRVDPWDALAT